MNFSARDPGKLVWKYENKSRRFNLKAFPHRHKAFEPSAEEEKWEHFHKTHLRKEKIILHRKSRPRAWMKAKSRDF